MLSAPGWYAVWFHPSGRRMRFDEPGPGCAGCDLWAPSRAEAQALARRLGLAHAEVTSGPYRRPLVPWALPSALLRQRRTNYAKALHAASLIGMFAVRSRACSLRDLLGDDGLLHRLAHLASGIPERKRDLAAAWADLERRVPGIAEGQV